MIDFKVLVKVAKGHELDTLRTLGTAVEDNEEAFLDVDPRWVSKQEFITAVPVEIALTTDVRNVLMSNNPHCRFIVTGVPVERVKTMVERYSYVVAHTDIKPEPKELVEEERDEAPVQSDAPVQSANYFINGKPVSAQEFNDRAEEILTKMKSFWEDFGI